MLIPEFLALAYDSLVFAYAARREGYAWALQFFIPLAIFGHLIDVCVISQGKLVYADAFLLTITGVPIAASFTWGGIIYPILRLSRKILIWAKPNPLSEKTWLVSLLCSTSAVLLDIVIEHVAMALQLWNWTEDPMIVSIPIRNLIGWFLLTGLYTLAFQEVSKRGTNPKSFLIMTALTIVTLIIVLVTLILMKPILAEVFQ